MSCEHVGLEMKLSAVRTNERGLVQTVGTQHENRRLWQLRNRPMMAQNFNYLTTFNKRAPVSACYELMLAMWISLCWMEWVCNV